jgi:hypothetical protein
MVQTSNTIDEMKIMVEDTSLWMVIDPGYRELPGVALTPTRQDMVAMHIILFI